jgi:hypothetical protein
MKYINFRVDFESGLRYNFRIEKVHLFGFFVRMRVALQRRVRMPFRGISSAQNKPPCGSSAGRFVLLCSL